MNLNKTILLIPHFNNFEGLLASVKSIKEKIKIDILIVDDGSNKSEKSKIEKIKEIYSGGKIFILNLIENQGIEIALNQGLKFIEKHNNYTYIARLDCGDLQIENKLTKQITYLDKKPDIYLLGTWVNYVDQNGKFLFTLKHPIDYSTIKKKMYINSMFVHPSVVFRRKVLKEIGYYPTNFPAAEDYEFFFKIVKKYKVENYPETLLNYTIDENSISSQKRKIQVKSRIKIILKNYKFSIYPTYGLFRNILLLIISRNLANRVKKSIFNN